MKQVTFTTELGSFIAVFGKLDAIDVLPEHKKNIGNFKDLDAAKIWNEIGAIPIGIAGAIYEYNPLILKQS